jgi:hypothetical protein
MDAALRSMVVPILGFILQHVGRQVKQKSSIKIRFTLDIFGVFAQNAKYWGILRIESSSPSVPG